MPKSLVKFTIIGILALGIIFRLGNLDTKFYREDEIYTSMRVSGYKLTTVAEAIHGNPVQVGTLSQYQDVKSGQSWSDTFVALANRPEHTPLYYLLARVWAELFGSSVLSMRAFPALVSVLSLPLFYWMALLLFRSSSVANSTLCLACVSPILIRYAQEARPYSLWIFGVLLSSIMLIRAIRLNKKQDWLFYGISILLIFLTHLLSTLVLLVQTLYILITLSIQNTALKASLTHHSLNSLSFNKNIINYQKAGRFFLTSGIFLTLLVPWFRLLIRNRYSVQEMTNWLNQKQSIGKILLEYSKNFSYTLTPVFSSQNTQHFPLTLILFLLLILSVFKMIFRSDLYSWLLIVLLCVVPTGTLIILDLFFGGIRSTVSRYLLPTYIGFLFALGFGLSFTHLIPQNSLKSYNWLHIFTIQVVFTVAISASWSNLHSLTWWGNPRLELEASQVITNVSREAIVISDIRLAKFMSLAFLLRSTDQILWLEPGQTVSLENIIGNSKDGFLFEPSDSLLNSFYTSEMRHQYLIKPIPINNTVLQLIEEAS